MGKILSYISGFPKLLIHRYPLDTLTDLHVPPKFCYVSLKKRPSVRINLGFYKFRPKIMVILKKSLQALNQARKKYGRLFNSSVFNS